MKITLDGLSSRRPLGTILSDAGLVSPEALDQALIEQRMGDRKERLGTILVRLGLVTPSKMLWALSRQFPIVRPFGAGL